MPYDVFTSRCGCGRILKRLEQCTACVSLRRAEAVAKAGPKRHQDGHEFLYTSKEAGAWVPPYKLDWGMIDEATRLVRESAAVPRDILRLKLPPSDGMHSVVDPRVANADTFKMLRMKLPPAEPVETPWRKYRARGVDLNGEIALTRAEAAELCDGSFFLLNAGGRFYHYDAKCTFTYPATKRPKDD